MSTGEANEVCNAKLMRADVPDSQSLFCNKWKGHEGQHSHTFPSTFFPEIAHRIAENQDLREIKDSLTTLTVSVAALNGNHKGLKEQLDAIAKQVGCTGGVHGIAGELAELRNDFSNGGFKAFFVEEDRRLIREFIKAKPPRKREAKRCDFNCLNCRKRRRK